MPGLQQLWSLTPSNNRTADGQVNLREGQSPSSVNDAIRQIVAKVKAYALDTSGLLVTGGISTAYTLSTNEGFTALVDGMTVTFRPHVANGAAATLSVDGLAANARRHGSEPQATALATGLLKVYGLQAEALATLRRTRGGL